MKHAIELRAGDCPGLEALASFRARPEAHAGIGEHLKQCPACAAELSLFDRFERAEVSAAEQADVEAIVKGLRQAAKPQTGSRWTDWFAPRQWAWVAGALVLMVGFSIEWNRQSVSHIYTETGSGVMRAAGRLEWLPGQALSLATAPGQLEWKALAGVKDYRVTITEVDGTVVWSSEVKEAKASLEAAKGFFLPHKLVTLQVRARMADGQPGPSTPAIRVRVE